MEPNSKPRAFSLSTMPWQKAWILLTIPFQMAVMAFRNSSLVSHRCLNAATRTAMTAITASTGAEMPPRAAPSLPKIPVPALTATPSFFTPVASFTKPCIATPTLEMTVPRITSSGPRAAMIRPMVSTALRWLSLMPFSLSTKA